MADTEQDVYVGRYYGERQRDITPEMVEAYSDAVGDYSPWYFGDSPLGAPIAPALILHSEVYREVNWYLSFYGNLHARQEWELFHPVRVGDRLVARNMIVDRYLKRDREYVVNEVSVFGEDGRLVSRARTHQSFLTRRESGDVVGKDREKSPQRRFDVEEEGVIESLTGPEKDITLGMCRKFSGPAKNYHTDVEEARKLGFPDVVVQGMMSLCFLSEMMTARYGLGWYTGGRMNVNLVNVLWQGESVTAHGRVLEVTPEGSRSRHQLQVWCEKSDGTKIVVGTASALEAGTGE
jgi:acyl dehydratase